MKDVNNVRKDKTILRSVNHAIKIKIAYLNTITLKKNNVISIFYFHCIIKFILIFSSKLSLELAQMVHN